MLNLTLLPYSGYELHVCPGLKEYPAAVHFESKHYMHITTPYDQHQSDGCSVWPGAYERREAPLRGAHKLLVWHIPKNRQPQYCGPLFNMCDPCKRPYNQLEIIKKCHESFSPSKREAWMLPSYKRPLMYCSPHTGIQVHVHISP